MKHNTPPHPAFRIDPGAKSRLYYRADGHDRTRFNSGDQELEPILHHERAMRAKTQHPCGITASEWMRCRMRCYLRGKCAAAKLDDMCNFFMTREDQV